MDQSTRPATTDIEISRQRRLVAMHLQVIENNPLSAEDVAMFEMFEREAWPHERCLAYILSQAQAPASE